MGSAPAAVTTELGPPSPWATYPAGRLGFGAPVDTVLLLLAGLGAGASAALSGFYDVSLWGPISLAVMALLVGLWVIERRRLPTTALVAIGALAALWAWATLSKGWTESPGQAILVAQRWGFYAALLASLVMLLRRGAPAWIAVAGYTLGILGIVAYLEIKMLSGHGGELFLAQRLNSPLGYVNGQGSFLLMALWPLVAVAERGRPRLLSALCVGAAALLGALLVLTQSRGVALGFGAGALVVVAAVPGRQRRLWVLLPIVAGLMVIGGHLLDVYQDPVTKAGLPHDDTVRTAASWSLAMALGVGALWGAIDFLLSRFAAGGPGAARTVRRVSSVALAAIAVAGIGVAIASQHRVRKTVSDQYHAFIQLRGAGSKSRFLSGGGHRYDYWRIAVDEFDAHPLRGVGAGGYQPTYFRERRTDEDITQPHSMQLQALAELGLVGVLFVALFGLAGIVGFVRLARLGRTDGLSRVLAVGAGGTYFAWLAHTSVDWLHIIPGLTAVALIAMAILVAGGPAPSVVAEPAAPRRRPLALAGIAGRVALAVAIALAAAWIGRLTLAQHYRSEGNKLLASNPLGALKQSSKALAYDPDTVQGYYLKSAALARLNLYRPARAALFDATFRGHGREAKNFVTWVLIGDLAVRREKKTQATTAYTRAAELNPRDATVKELAKRLPTVEE
jgi:O-Antigen ligase